MQDDDRKISEHRRSYMKRKRTIEWNRKEERRVMRIANSWPLFGFLLIFVFGWDEGINISPKKKIFMIMGFMIIPQNEQKITNYMWFSVANTETLIKALFKTYSLMAMPSKFYRLSLSYNFFREYKISIHQEQGPRCNSGNRWKLRVLKVIKIANSLSK